MCLDASIRAFGGRIAHLSLASVAVVFLAGNALGSAAPTPGGVGAVEATLTVGLIAVGLPKEVAAPAVLLLPPADALAAGTARMALLQHL